MKKKIHYIKDNKRFIGFLAMPVVAGTLMLIVNFKLGLLRFQPYQLTDV